MSFGICHLSVVPVRKEPSDKSEMTTQLLFGETVAISESYQGWLKIRIITDNYEGWIDGKQILKIESDTFNEIEKSDKQLSLDLVQVVHMSRQKVIPLLMGSTLPGLKDKVFRIVNDEYHYDGMLSDRNGSREKIIEYALMYLNAPYLWGGKTPFGIDCSGLVQMVYRLNGIPLLRDAAEQAEQGEMLSFISDALPADLLFFDNADGDIIHTGILLPDGKIIHASGKVRIDKVDHQGIFNEEQKKYTHHLRLIKRII